MRNTIRAQIYREIVNAVKALPVVARVVNAAEPDGAVAVPEGKVVALVAMGPDFAETPPKSVEALKLPVIILAFMPAEAPGGMDDEEFAADVCGDFYTTWWRHPELLGNLAANGEIDTFCTGAVLDGPNKLCAHSFTLTYRFTVGKPTEVR